MTKKYDIFISYRRDGGTEAALHLRDILETKGYRVFLDLVSMPGGYFSEKIKQTIQDSRDFILIESPNAFDRCNGKDDWVKTEVLMAKEMGKNIIPVQLEGFDMKSDIPDEMKFVMELQTVFIKNDYYLASFQRLEKYLLSRRKIPLSNLVRGILLLTICVALVLLSTNKYFAKYPRNDDQRIEVNNVFNMTSELLDKYARANKEFNTVVELSNYYVLYSGDKNLIEEHVKQSEGTLQEIISEIENIEYSEDSFDETHFSSDKFENLKTKIAEMVKNRLEFVKYISKAMKERQESDSFKSQSEKISYDKTVGSFEKSSNDNESEALFSGNTDGNVIPDKGGSLLNYYRVFSSLEDFFPNVIKQATYENDILYYSVNDFLLPLTDRAEIVNYMEDNVSKKIDYFSANTGVKYTQEDVDDALDSTYDNLEEYQEITNLFLAQ